MKSNLIVSWKSHIQIREESKWENLMTISRKIVSSMKLLFFTHLSRIKRLKESIELLYVLFGLSLLNKKSLSYYGLRLQKKKSTYRIKVLLAKALQPHIKIWKVRSRILVSFAFLDAGFNYIYSKKSGTSLMKDFIKVFMLAMKALISTAYTILIAAVFLLLEMCTLIKLITMIAKI